MTVRSDAATTLDARARGWLRFVWDKATTADDWSSAGEPHPWWDRYSTPPMCSLGRFDLHETGYVLPVMCDVTPAWREVYTRIADELVGRYTTFWAAIDWLSMIGHDPSSDRYPPMWLAVVPEYLRGQVGYDLPGWVANGVAPWGLQPDPVGADGNNFFRGFFNLLLGFYEYVSGDDKWASPFKVCGYSDRLFQWDRHSLVEFMTDQWAERPAGVHCENTKIWPFCVSGAGLGLQLYDHLHGSVHRRLFEAWSDYAQKHYMKLDRRGEIEWFTFYYDPIRKANLTLRPGPSVYAALAVAPYVHPQDPAFGELLYRSAVRTLGWSDPGEPRQLHPDPRWIAIGVLMARELGDRETEARLRAVAERDFEPRFFGADDERFGWFFGNGEPWPRGQLASLMVLSELGEPGSWFRVFNEPNLAKFDQPTVTGVDYPRLGVATAFNDLESGELHLRTYAATAAARGTATTVRVEQLPNPSDVRIVCDGADFTAWRTSDADAVEIQTDIAEHEFRIATGYHGQARERTARATAGATATTSYRPDSSGAASCCG
ncbi:MAG: linalool dehydratase/isomerase domain-containing protein [Sporichthyaceae bacterium]